MKHSWPKTKRSRSSGGFSLIEVMLALTILSFGLLSLAAMQLYAMQGRSSGRHSTAAAEFAQTKMDQLQRRRWDETIDTGGAWTSANEASIVTRDGTDEAHQAFVVNWRITDEVANTTKLLDVRVTWTEEPRGDRAFAMSSIRFNRGS